jgi:lipid-binding SYLF domain-containing protein
MKKIIVFLCASFLLMTSNTDNVYATNKWENLLEESGKVLAEIQGMPDQSIPESLLENCHAIAIFPSTISAGLGIGGKYGQGVIVVRNERTKRWSNPAVFTIAGGSIGWQIGGQATDFVLVVTKRRSVDGLLQGKFKLGADAAVSAGPVGRNAEVAADVQLKGSILAYSRSRGLFLGVKLTGDVITQHWEGNRVLYGKSLSAKEILIENKANMPKAAIDLLEVLSRYR